MGLKKSDFSALQSTTDSDTFDFVQNGQNYKITKQDLVAGLGVTGSLAQTGSITGVPILDVQGTVNNIRNVEASTGVIASLSPQNGLALKTALLPAGVGVEVLFNESTAPQFRSLIAGDGISLASIGDSIQVALSGAPTSSKTVIVNQLSDFPTPVAGVITLLANVDYFVSADITTSNRFVGQANTVLRGPDLLIGKLIYTGTGIMITSLDATFKVSCIQCLCTSGTFCDVSNSSGNEGTSTFILDGIVVAANHGGTLTSLSGLQIRQGSFTFITTGFVFAGTGWTNLNCVGFAGTQLAGKMFDLGSTAFDRPLFDNFSLTLAGGTFGISGVINSGNINAGGLGVILTGRTTGAGTLLENISVNDDSWTLSHNDEIGDTHPDGLLSMQGNATATVIASAGVGVLVAGTWVTETLSQATGTAAGRVTYTGSRPAKLPMTASVTIEPVSGGSQTMGARIAIDGVAQANSLRTTTASAGNPSSITIPWQEELITGQYVEVFVSNETGTTNVLVSSAISRVN